jgi:hypothetical protein
MGALVAASLRQEKVGGREEGERGSTVQCESCVCRAAARAHRALVFYHWQAAQINLRPGACLARPQLGLERLAVLEGALSEVAAAGAAAQSQLTADMQRGVLGPQRLSAAAAPQPILACHL